jgi:anti-sigma factor RsiW
MSSCRADLLGEGIFIVNCREALEHFGEHVDGELTSSQRWRLRLHLWICGQCRKYLRSYRATVALERAAFQGDDAASNNVPDELVKTILSAAHAPPASGEGNPPPSAR